jgi:NAD(P)-dependent dehydrogenase (short-subunit alcohol dehydrogenase family)
MAEDRVIIVTGGASGIGKETAYLLADEGVKLVIADFNEPLAKQVAEEIAQKGGTAVPFVVDVAQKEQVAAMVDFAVEKFGTLTGIFNNAGIGLQAPLLEMDPPKYDKLIHVDQYSVYYGIYYAGKKMVELGVKNGVIINTASIYGYFSAVASFNYNAAKAAVIAMSRSGALELAPHNIRVVGVAPGFIDTPILDDLDEATKNYLGNQHMRGKLIQPQAVAKVVRFLFSDDAEAINGSTIPVDDGFLCFK